jgi:hypothetical protein
MAWAWEALLSAQGLLSHPCDPSQKASHSSWCAHPDS